MNKASFYLLKHFLELFSALFFYSVFYHLDCFFHKITALTAIITMNFWELGTLYIYLLPKTLVYTLPITFFIALSISLYNLSKENETIVLFTLGYDPKKITRLFMSLATGLSVILLIDIMVLVPISKQLNSNFIEYKKAEAKFNIKANEFGQKFSDWLIYIEHSDNAKQYEGITLYHNPEKQEDKEQLILANAATINNESGILRLHLDAGKVFEFQKDGIGQTDFETMYINSQPKTAVGAIQTVKEYWNDVFVNWKRAYDLSFFLTVALFPIASTMIAMSIGIVTYRYNKESIYMGIFLCLAFYLTLTTVFSSKLPQYAPLIVFTITMIASYVLYQKRIRRVF
ncbi:MAG: LptF/LptG family permease [Sulfurospirillum cavolei]|nr:LptF/LptG family permease [Sulfurospirillum cavolei]